MIATGSSRLFATAAKRNIAVVLSGCGVYDGSEIHEAVFVLESISRRRAQYQCFAPNIPQMHVVNHLTGEPSNEQRNVLTESARIARSNVLDIEKLDLSKFDAGVFRGSLGAAKNLSLPSPVTSVINAFHSAKKPIGACCIAPVLLARTLPGVHVTLGQEKVCDENPYADACGAAKIMGATHVQCKPTEVCVDKENRIVTTPAYMHNSPIHVVRDGIDNMIEELLKLM
ncbi:hypothetical protein WA577_007080 [Blastocystis sp. JDR]